MTTSATEIRQNVKENAIFRGYNYKERSEKVKGIRMPYLSGTDIADLVDFTKRNIITENQLWATDSWFGRQTPHLVPVWETTTSAFEEDNQQTPGGLIDDLRDNYNISYADKLADRLQYLVKVGQEDFPDQMPVSPKSLSDFIGFINAHNTFKRPRIYLTFSGNIRAEWGEVNDQHFAIEFLEDNDVRFVLFASDIRRPHKVYRASGSSSVDKIMRQVEPYNVLRWVSNEMELV